MRHSIKYTGEVFPMLAEICQCNEMHVPDQRELEREFASVAFDFGVWK
jgi:hypothetical protein